MRFACVLSFLVLGASGEISGCVVEPDGSHTCHGALPLGDVTSLLQVHKRQQDAEEHGDRLVAGAATATRRCSGGQYGTDEPNPDCAMEEWSEWDSCTKTCGSGTRTRSRKVTSAPDGVDCGCLEETETCNSNGCDATTTTATTTTEGQGGTLGVTKKVCGIVRDAADATNVIDKATVKIGDVTTESNSTGKFCADVEVGEYTLTGTKQPEWLDTEQQLSVTEETEDVTVDMSKKLPPKDWRIILSWGKTPLDLDARTQFGKFDPKPTWRGDCSVFYEEKGPKTCSLNGIEGQVDQDHCYFSTAGNPGRPCGASASKGSKPETTTLKNVDASTCKNDCKIGFHVSNYVGSSIHWWKSDPNTYPLPSGVPEEDTGTLADSEATVRVIHGEEEVAFFELAKQQGFLQWPGSDASEWWVFTIDVSTSKVVECKDANCFS